MNKRKSMIILATLVAILALGPIFATQTFAGKGEPGVEVTKTISTADGTTMTGVITVCNETDAAVTLSSAVDTLSEKTGPGKPTFNPLTITSSSGLPVGSDVIPVTPCRTYSYTLNYTASTDARSLKNRIAIVLVGNPSIFSDQDSFDISDPD